MVRGWLDELSMKVDADIRLKGQLMQQMVRFRFTGSEQGLAYYQGRLASLEWVSYNSANPTLKAKP